MMSKRVRAVVRTIEAPDRHPRVLGCRWPVEPMDKNYVGYWLLTGDGWAGVRRAAHECGFDRAKDVSRDSAMAWGCVDEAAEAQCRRLTDEEARALIGEIGKPMGRAAAGKPYKPVTQRRPPGREGAARVLARTGLPSELSDAALVAVYRMFQGMAGAAQQRAVHVKFWGWACKARGITV